MELKDNDILQAIRDKVWTIAPNGSQAFLFGSRARGDARQDSDWDILILLDKERILLSDIDEVSYPLRELGWEIGADINPVLYTINDWKQNSFTPFNKNVTEEGISL